MDVLICEICESALGTFDPNDLAVPLTPAMFHPLEPGFPPPFQPEADWEHMFCPRCGKRAMGWDESNIEGVRRDRLRSRNGYLVVPVPYVEPFPVSIEDGAEVPAPVVPALSKTSRPFPSKVNPKSKGKKKNGR